MSQNSRHHEMPSMEEIKKIAQSDAGKNLYSALQRSHGSQLENAMEYASSGNLTEAKNALTEILNAPEFKTFLKQLGGPQDG